jgi:5'-nucleotidase
MILPPNPTPPERGLFCNRTLNLRAIQAVGYDMDYTLIHYHVEEWEQRAYEAVRAKLAAKGWPVDGLRFEPELVIRGLVIDTELGNLVKANRFGFVKKALHGTRTLDYAAQRAAYARTIVDLHEPRWVFLNTLFSLSEACLYAQLVDRLDDGKIEAVMGYQDLYRTVRTHLDAAHTEGELKADVLAAPERYVQLDEETALALLDQQRSGKKLLLITNSEWTYTVPIMKYAFDRFMPAGTNWRDLFEVVIVGARKPEFFTGRAPLFEVATEDGLLKPVRALERGKAYFGGSAQAVEQHLGISGDEILYVGDHVFGDVHVTKAVLRWRTALILRELEAELRAVRSFNNQEAELARLMDEKELLEARACQLRLAGQRSRAKYGPACGVPEADLQRELAKLKEQLTLLDSQVAPLARTATEQGNSTWGLLMRAGNDKSHLARQVERYSDIYTSRVSNLLYATPFAFLRSPRGSLPHDMPQPGGRPSSPGRLAGTLE